MTPTQQSEDLFTKLGAAPIGADHELEEEMSAAASEDIQEPDDGEDTTAMQARLLMTMMRSKSGPGNSGPFGRSWNEQEEDESEGDEESDGEESSEDAEALQYDEGEEESESAETMLKPGPATSRTPAPVQQRLDGTRLAWIINTGATRNIEQRREAGKEVCVMRARLSAVSRAIRILILNREDPCVDPFARVLRAHAEKAFERYGDQAKETAEEFLQWAIGNQRLMPENRRSLEDAPGVRGPVMSLKAKVEEFKKVSPAPAKEETPAPKKAPSKDAQDAPAADASSEEQSAFAARLKGIRERLEEALAPEVEAKAVLEEAATDASLDKKQRGAVRLLVVRTVKHLERMRRQEEQARDLTAGAMRHRAAPAKPAKEDKKKRDKRHRDR